MGATGQGESGSEDGQDGFFHLRALGQPHPKDPPTSSTCIRRPTPPEATPQGHPNQFKRTKGWMSHMTEDASQRQEEVKRTKARKSLKTEGASQRQEGSALAPARPRAGHRPSSWLQGPTGRAHPRTWPVAFPCTFATRQGPAAAPRYPASGGNQPA